ncbi:GntR family transcriptional regulator [Desulfosediminicola flagellatus]|uniref:GntR family transcriptional regulator n=1 Tax=Desulfosediminicola flagellatus TaxID=2569541 RepID=UPI0010AC1ED3|nr:GntR family transcriptional regulator [Desulfosediminicola flagellatus]
MVFKSLNDAAYSIIRTKILRGEFELGSRIREDVLAEEISISRTPVREAINRLVADGIIIKKSQKGLYLIDPEPEEIEDNIDIRTSLEKLSVTKCIQRSTDTDIEKISNVLNTFEEALTQKDYDACNELDAEFHTLIAQLSKNSSLIKLLDHLSAFFQLVRKKEKKSNPAKKNKRTLEEHLRIAEAIKRRDILAAQKAVEKNIQTMRKNLFIDTK